MGRVRVRGGGGTIRRPYTAHRTAAARAVDVRADELEQTMRPGGGANPCQSHAVSGKADVPGRGGLIHVVGPRNDTEQWIYRADRCVVQRVARPGLRALVKPPGMSAERRANRGA